MDAGGAQHKSGGVSGGMGEAGHLRSVSVAMKEGKPGHGGHGEKLRYLAIRQNGQPKKQDRGGDPGFHRKKRNPRQAEDSADQNKKEERGRNGPDGSPPSCTLRSPTLSMARKWSKPKMGWANPLVKPSPWRPTWAQELEGRRRIPNRGKNRPAIRITDRK